MERWIAAIEHFLEREWARNVAWVLFAAWGGGAGYLMRSLERRETFSYLRVLLEMCASGFVGLLVVFLCRAMDMSQYWTGLVVGVSGWLGASVSIKMLERKIYKELGLTTEYPAEPVDQSVIDQPITELVEENFGGHNEGDSK